MLLLRICDKYLCPVAVTTERISLGGGIGTDTGSGACR